MARYDVTPELAATIKTVRLQNHIASKNVAAHINKSPSYLTKLEKGEIKTIEEAELTAIFRFIFGNDKDFQDFLDSSLGQILRTLELRYSDEEINNQLWFANYDTVLRLIPVPSALVDDIVIRLNKQKLTPEQLVEKINLNESLVEDVKDPDSYPFNEWQGYVKNHRIIFQFIKLKLDISEIKHVLKKEKASINYVSMLAIAYHLFKIELCGFDGKLSLEEDKETMRTAIEYLNSYKFYSISELNNIKKQVASKAELDAVLSSFDKENSILITQILEQIRLISQIDILSTNKNLTEFLKNLKWDNSFTMALLNSKFYELEDLSFTAKKELLFDIRALLEKYKDLPDSRRRTEKYD